MLTPSANADPSSASALSRAVLGAGLAFALGLLARLISEGDPLRLLFWPAAGVALAFGWRHGVVWTAPAALGAFAYGLLAFRDFGLATVAAAVTLAASVLPVLVIRRLADWKPAESRLESVVRFLLCTMGVGAPVAALMTTAALLVGGPPGIADSALHTGIAAWLAVTLGTLLIAPPTLAWIDDGNPQTEPAERTGPFIDAPGLLLGVLLAGAGIALALLGEPRLSNALMFLYFPIVVWAALRTDERGNALTLLLTAIALLGARTWPASITGDGYPQFVEVSVLVFSAVVVGLVLQAVASDRRLALMRVARQARQDMTTGLLNDRGLLSELGARLASAQRPNLGLIGLHLSNFDAVSDLCGTIQAMQLEQGCAALLQRQPALLLAARLSSGRYALVVEADTVAQVRAVARDVYSHLAGQRFATEHGNLRLQACVGGLLLDRHTLIDAEDSLASLADALAIAASVRDPQLFVEPLSQMMIDARRAHQSKLEHIREAVQESRIELFAQPVVDPEAPAGSLSYEVLTRLRDRDGLLVQPPEFLTLAVQAQMSVPLDRAIVRRTFEWLAQHPLALARTHKCSINLSGATMSDGAIAEYIRQQRVHYGIPPERIVFEITESEAIRNPSAASRLVDDLKSQGFGIALDDFGTGLATFEYLKRFPLDYLKIDGSFIRNLNTSVIDEEIVMSTVRVARRLKLRTVAEHVHSESLLSKLQELGVEYLQGDLFGQPAPIAALFERFAQGPTAVAAVPPATERAS